MTIKIRNIEVKLKKREVQSTKRAISQFISHVKELSEGELAPTYYFTLLIMMHIMSQEFLNDFSPETLAEIMNKLGGREIDE